MFIDGSEIILIDNISEKLLHKEIENPVIESDATGWTKFFSVHIRFASGIADLEAARAKVYQGSHWARFKATTDDYIDEYNNGTDIVQGWDDTFGYEALDSFSDPLATRDKLDQMDGQLQSLLPLLQAVQTL